MNEEGLLNDSDLLTRFVAGEQRAFDTLFNRYVHKLFVFTKRYSPDEEEAKELVMDVMLRLWQKGKHAAEIKSVESYLFRSVKNAIIDNYRKKCLTVTPLASVHEELQGHFNADDPINQRELHECIREGVEMLSPGRRQVFELRREQDLNPKEIAQRLDISAKTAENQLTRAIAFLKGHIRKNTDFIIPTISLFCFFPI